MPKEIAIIKLAKTYLNILISVILLYIAPKYRKFIGKVKDFKVQNDSNYYALLCFKFS